MNLLELALYFMMLSLISVGGMPSVLPELQRYAVDVKGWMTADDFIQVFAVGQAAPGPNILIAALVGWKVAGLGGALVALGAMCGPAAVVAWWVAEAWERFKDSPWRLAIQRAIAPLVVGLTLAGGYVLCTPSTPDPRLWAIAAASATVMVMTKINPLWMLGVGGLVGDRGLAGVLDDQDLMMHTLFDSPKEQPIADSGYADKPVELRRWK
jgi:chromate transporter